MINSRLMLVLIIVAAKQLFSSENRAGKKDEGKKKTFCPSFPIVIIISLNFLFNSFKGFCRISNGPKLVEFSFNSAITLVDERV